MESTVQGHGGGARFPQPLKAGDKVRLVSPATRPSEHGIAHVKNALESWGLQVELGKHVLGVHSLLGYLAGSDEARLKDFNDALRDPEVRAIVATRGGKGAYRIADGLDFAAARADPKFVVGFSEISILHLALWQRCGLVGIHGALASPDADFDGSKTDDALRRALTTREPIVLNANPDESTSVLTTTGKAGGFLLGGNLDMMAAAAGWTLPSLAGAIVLIEAVEMGLGQVDRQLTMLANSGAFNGLSAVAVGQFTSFKPHGSGTTIVDVLRDRLSRLGVPILGGLPIGHGSNPRTALIGAYAELDADAGTLTIQYAGS